MINIVIPVQEETQKLEDCVDSIEKYTSNYLLTIHKAGDLNVAEARQQAMDENKSRYICFLDDDTRLIHAGWLEKMVEALQEEDVGVAFAEEYWENFEVMVPYPITREVTVGPAACMLVDTHKIPSGLRWDKYIGLKSGWLGGDYEEVEYIGRLKSAGIKSVGVKDTRFLHSDRVEMSEYMKTDRNMTSYIMNALIMHKCMHNFGPEYFRKLKYVRADPNNDRMLATGSTLKECFRDVLFDNGIQHFPCWQRLGLI